MKTIKKSELMERLGNFVSVENLPSRNGQNSTPNQFDITFENGSVFQSYSSLIAVKIGGELYLSRKHDFSNTTNRFCTAWSGRSLSERRAGLENGTITLID